MKAHEQVPVFSCRKNRIKRAELEGGCRNVGQNFLDVTGLVRSVQRLDGHSDCFRRGFCDCDHLDCPWREQCFQRG